MARRRARQQELARGEEAEARKDVESLEKVHNIGERSRSKGRGESPLQTNASQVSLKQVMAGAPQQIGASG